ncbi:DNA polymerase I [Sphingobacterium sp. DK4209]|uniref:DNA polymerase I n=1 Tax=Sphingobacterium zhuxiongii TaxID=2662364 RepID=A0A5Q0QFE6_9SPHI|nr:MULTISPECIES: DNA polymerase I [unclassified Sphingobacterium]MVZ66800.1 DNA polymerase I [Sphingobacterium sp. DK4209]QGA28034.1 DNA polymerase I [Sphingobacterium sp. dk4302]
MKKLFLLDGMALIYRAYFALSKTPRLTSYGLNTGAILGFTNTLLDVLKNQQPTHIAVVFDTAAPTNRQIEFESYKAHREKMPEDLAASIPYINRLIEGFNIPILTMDGFEADDIIGTLAKKGEQLGFTVYCMTPDKDFGQLVSENIFIYKPARMGNGAEVLGVPEILEKWEINNVHEVIDILGLWGDAVDNIPGIPGVGEKTAKKLVQEFGSVENLIQNTDKLKGKLKENVENFSEQGLISKKLATILLDVPVELDEKAFELEEPNRELLESLFSELEFRTLGKRVFGDEFSVADSPVAKSAQMDLFAPISDIDAAPSLQASPEEVPASLNNISTTTHNYVLVDTLEKQQELVSTLNSVKSFCFDTESTGLDAMTAELVGMSFSITSSEAYYVPVSSNKVEAHTLVDLFKPVLQNDSIQKVGQNLKYDLLILARYGVRVAGPLFDTMLAHYLIDPDTRHNMDILAETYLRYTPVSITELIGPKGKNQGNMRDVELEKIKEYAAEDADITLQLKELFEPLLKETSTLKLAEDVEFPLVYVLAEIEKNGVKIDEQTLKQFSVEIESEVSKLESTIYEKAGVVFNIASPKQLGEVLFDKLQLDPKAKKTKTGQYKTGEDVLLTLANKSDIVKDILDFRQLQKLKSTYVDALPSLVNPNSGLIHTSYNQAVAATGRLSSTNPNLQNIPIRTERGREVRKAFISRQSGWTILSADYSQIELRLIAELSQDANMLEAFQQGLDIHRATAAKVYGIDLEEVTSDMRRNAKAVNFGIIYGQSAFGLSQSLGIPRKEAAAIIDQYFTQYTGIRKYMGDIIEFAKEHGYVETLLKRRRYLRDINSANMTIRGFAERNAINAPIQGSAADLIKIAMINIQNDIEQQGLAGKMIMQVHDELVFDVPESEVEAFKTIITDRMKNAMKLQVPIEIEIGQGNNWLEAH